MSPTGHKVRTLKCAHAVIAVILSDLIVLFLSQAARIIAKLAAWGRDLMEGSDLNYYFNWIKTQLSSQVYTKLHFEGG